MCNMTYKRRKHRHKVRRKQRGGYVNKISKLAKIGMPMAMAAYDAYKKHKNVQKGGSNQSAIIARRFLSPGIATNTRFRQYGYGIKNKYGIAPRKSFYIHK